MPQNKLPEFIRRLTNLEKKMEEHLLESGTIKTNIKWNTWLTCAIAASLIAHGLSLLYK